MHKKRDIRAGAVSKVYAKAAWKHSWLMSLVLIGAICAELAGVIAPIYLSRFVNILAGGTPSVELVHALLVALGMFAFITFVGWFAQSISGFSTARMEVSVIRDLFNEAFEKLLMHSHEFFISNFTGSLTRRVTRYAYSFERIFDTVVFNFLPAIVFAGGAIIVLSLRSVELGAGLLAWTILFLYVQFIMTRRVHALRLKSSEADSEVTGSLSDTVMNHVTITTFAMLAHERASFSEKVATWYRATARSWNANTWINIVQGFLAVSINVGILYAAVFFWQKGALTIGDFLLIQVYILGLRLFLFLLYI